MENSNKTVSRGGPNNRPESMLLEVAGSEDDVAQHEQRLANASNKISAHSGQRQHQMMITYNDGDVCPGGQVDVVVNQITSLASDRSRQNHHATACIHTALNKCLHLCREGERHPDEIAECQHKAETVIRNVHGGQDSLLVEGGVRHIEQLECVHDQLSFIHSCTSTAEVRSQIELQQHLHTTRTIEVET